MRAVVAVRHGGPEVLEVREVPEPRAGPGEILIRVRSAGVNFADTQATRGEYHSAPKPPFIPGLEVAGEEIESGRPVIALLRGGGYAEVVAADSRLVFDAEGLDLERAGGLPIVTFTSFFVLKHYVRLTPGDRLLVHAAAGGLGISAMQTARALGAGSVTGVASTPEKRRFALQYGADQAIDYEDEYPRVDLVVDGVGGAAFEKALDAIEPAGRIAMLGWSSGTAPEIPGFEELRRRAVAICGFSFGQFSSRQPQRVADGAGPLLEFLRNGQVSPPVGRLLPLGGAGQAHELLSGRQSQGKVILTVAS